MTIRFICKKQTNDKSGVYYFKHNGLRAFGAHNKTFHVGIIINNIKTLREHMYDARRMCKAIAGKITHQHRLLKTWETVYFYQFSRDCDMCESGGYYFADNYAAFLKAEENMYEWAEGTCYMNEVGKQEFDAHNEEKYHRDRVLKAYENGNGNSIYV